MGIYTRKPGRCTNAHLELMTALFFLFGTILYVLAEFTMVGKMIPNLGFTAIGFDFVAGCIWVYQATYYGGFCKRMPKKVKEKYDARRRSSYMSTAEMRLSQLEPSYDGRTRPGYIEGREPQTIEL